MKVSELYRKLDEKIPGYLSENWDNDGLMLCPDPDREAEKVLFTLDVTEEAADVAVKNGFDLIISHHPLIFTPLKGITDPLLVKLMWSGISVFSFHTRFDALTGGVNDALCIACGASVSERGVCDERLGVVGKYDDPMSPEALAAKVRECLGSPSVQLASAGKECRRVAFIGGSGGSSAVSGALDVGADALVSGEIGYNAMLDGMKAGLTVITAGHFSTEQPAMKYLEEIVRSVADINARQYDCRIIKQL
ncbi:MAG: Nif3-like dinuclear metal center hexameric protein [Clostridia bacterium]|nr:Nif3-like dinuclear metal center hexameric protein [Clostridia bacterium]